MWAGWWDKILKIIATSRHLEDQCRLVLVSAPPKKLLLISGSEGDASWFATGGRVDCCVPLAGVTWNGGSLLLRRRVVLLHHLVVLRLLHLVVFPRRVSLFPGLPVPMARLPILVFSPIFSVEVWQWCRLAMATLALWSEPPRGCKQNIMLYHESQFLLEVDDFKFSLSVEGAGVHHVE